ncbi:MAG TPA: tRNA-dependent cyclodipeptide synthase [Micavibrio sp.]
MIKHKFNPLPRNGELGISLGNSAHEGENLRRMLTWTHDNFAQTIITLSDTLYRFNLMDEGCDEDHAYEQSRALGDAWLQRNQAVLHSFDPARLKIIRWDEWRAHPDFQKTHEDLVDFYHNHTPFREALHKDVAAFRARREKAGKPAPESDHAINFLLEEGAGYILIGRTYQSLRIYPSHDLHCFKYLRKNTVPTPLKGLELAPYFDFRGVMTLENANQNHKINSPVNKFG